MKKQVALVLTLALALVALWLTIGVRVVAELSLAAPVAIENPGLQIILRPEKRSVSTDQLLKAQQVVANRLEHLQPNSWYDVTVAEGQLEVRLNEHENFHYIQDIISHAGRIEFIDGGYNAPIGQFVETAIEPTTSDRFRTLFTGQEIVSVVLPESGQIFYRITPKPEATPRIEPFFANQADRFICLVIDGQVINCSKLYSWTDGTLEIMPSLGSGTGLGLSDLEIFLTSGPLPGKFEVATD
ncbi:MAG TPA: hypothetical protein PKE64_19725 [Anaerolineae bacterium]|nr:hypothetical protein [Anaerolineae bacterium]